MEVNKILRESDRFLTPDQHLNLFRAYLRHASMWLRSGADLVPKHHLMLHLIAAIPRLGNPRHFWTYRDESLNGVVVKLSKTAHRRTFCDTVHNKFRWLQKLGLCTHMF